MWVALISLTTVIIWFAWGDILFRFFVRAKNEYKNKCMEKVIKDQIEKGHEQTIKNMLLLSLLIPIAYLLPSLDLNEIMAIVASKGAKSGNIFGQVELNNVLAVPALAVLFSLIVYIVKFGVINKAISCLNDIECK